MPRTPELRIPESSIPLRRMQRLGEMFGIYSQEREIEIQASLIKQAELLAQLHQDKIHRLASSDACIEEISFLLGNTPVDPHPTHQIQFRDSTPVYNSKK